ncbi:hypothetical protein [Fibrobacter sp.]|uniref:hypothetical protein n=1 Tax=Fibrobacter sp. TaxID=35828 RepID=UPI00388D9320
MKNVKKPVLIAESVIQKADKYSTKVFEEKGVRLTKGDVFAEALNEFLTGKECLGNVTPSQDM